MATQPLKVLPVAAGTFENFKKQKLMAMITAAAENLERNFSALCEEFSQKFDAEQWILMQRANQSPKVYYIHAIAGVMPDLNKFPCAGNYDSSSYQVDSSSLNFAGFIGDLPSETEMNRCFNDRLGYFRADKKIRGYCGMTFKRNN